MLNVARMAVVSGTALVASSLALAAPGSEAAPAGGTETIEQALCRLIDGSARKHQLPIDFFTRLIWQESSFRTRVTSPAGAQGVAQFMPGTAAERGLADPFDPEQAIPKAAELLADLARRFGNRGLAAAAYNGGPTRVANWLERGGSLPSETEQYVFRITGRSAQEWADAAREKVEATRFGSPVLVHSGGGANPPVRSGRHCRSPLCTVGRPACRQLLQRASPGVLRSCAPQLSGSHRQHTADDPGDAAAQPWNAGVLSCAGARSDARGRDPALRPHPSCRWKLHRAPELARASCSGTQERRGEPTVRPNHGNRRDIGGRAADDRELHSPQPRAPQRTAAPGVVTARPDGSVTIRPEGSVTIEPEPRR